jgi:hypothetical protein
MVVMNVVDGGFTFFDDLSINAGYAYRGMSAHNRHKVIFVHPSTAQAKLGYKIQATPHRGC